MFSNWRLYSAIIQVESVNCNWKTSQYLMLSMLLCLFVMWIMVGT